MTGKINCNVVLLGVWSFLFTSIHGRIIYWDIHFDSSWCNHPSSVLSRWTTCFLASGEIKDKSLSDFCYWISLLRARIILGWDREDLPRPRKLEVRTEVARSEELLFLEVHKTYPLGPWGAGEPCEVMSLLSTSYFSP